MTTVLIRSVPQGWAWCPAGEPAAAGAGSVAALQAALEARPELSPVLILPAEDCTLKSLTLTAPRERRYLSRTLPYALEDELADRVENLHFAVARGDGREALAAVVERRRLRDLLAPFAGLRLEAVVPEILLLPLSPDEWTLLCEGPRCLLRHGAGSGLAVEADQLGLLLRLLLDQGEALPSRLTLYGDADAAEAALPAPLRAVLERQPGCYWEVLARRSGPPPLNCLQGEFAPRLPWGDWLRQWRVAAALLAAVLLLDSGGKALQAAVLESRGAALRDASAALYREIVPQGQLVEPALQLRRQVEELRGGTGESAMLALFARVAPLLAAEPGVSLQDLNWSGARGELQLTLLSASFGAAEAVRVRLLEAGLEAELTGSASAGGGSRSRFRIRERP